MGRYSSEPENAAKCELRKGLLAWGGLNTNVLVCVCPPQHVRPVGLTSVYISRILARQPRLSRVCIYGRPLAT